MSILQQLLAARMQQDSEALTVQPNEFKIVVTAADNGYVIRFDRDTGNSESRVQMVVAQGAGPLRTNLHEVMRSCVDAMLRRQPSGAMQPYHRYTDAEKARVKLMHESGISIPEIARQFNVPSRSISTLIAREKWAHSPKE